MKPKHSFSFSISCILIVLLSASCKKESGIVSQPCETCKPANLALSSILINDSNWVKQSGLYTSDLTTVIQKAGASASQVNSMYIVSGENLLQIFPDCQASFMGGTIYGPDYLLNNNDNCVITFGYLDQDEHFGEIPNGGALPFKSIEIKILLLK